VNKLELFLKDYIENLAKTYQICDISQLFSLFKTEKKTNANGLLNRSFIDLMKNESLKRNLLEYYSYLDSSLNQKLMEENCFENHFIINDEFKAVKKIIECVKYSEILFDF